MKLTGTPTPQQEAALYRLIVYLLTDSKKPAVDKRGEQPKPQSEPQPVQEAVR